MTFINTNYLFSQTYNISTNNNQTINTCSGTLFDSGGNTGDYSANEDKKITFCSTNNECIRIKFNSFNTESNYDFLYIYDGPNTSSPIRATLTGTSIPTDIFSSSSCITIRFVSDGVIQRAGFSITISCTPNCYIPPPPPSNNLPCSAINLAVSSQCNSLPFTNLNATTSSVPNPICATNYNGADVWFTATVPASGRLAIKITVGNLTNAGISIYTGQNCNNLTEIKCSVSNSGMPGTQYIYSAENLANQTIWIRVWGNTPNQGSFNLCAFEPPPFVNVSTNTYTPQQLVQDILITGCLSASNVTYNGANTAIGHFNAEGTILGFNSGIVMSTGNVLNVSGDGLETDPGWTTTQTATANDLRILAQQNSGTSSVHDVAVLEFDFVPSSANTQFRYVFGSNEYPNYNCSVYNDVFAFFISGPGISGPFSGNSKNVALIPGTNLPVCIVNIHDATGDNTWDPCPASYSQYYINNDPNFTSTTTDAFILNGFTVPLTANMVLQPCSTYHIRLAIADGGDGSLDSGVFLEAGSFSSGEQVVMNHFNYSNSNNDITYEGCENYIIFSRADSTNISQPLQVQLNITGTASINTDINPGAFPTNYFIPAGQISDTLFYTALMDGLSEGMETLIFSLGNGCPCNVQFLSDTIYIYDRDSLVGGIVNNDTIIQPGDCISLISTCNIPSSITTYNWSNSSTSQNINVCPAQTTTYYLTISEACGQSVIDSVTIFVAPPINPDFVVNDICHGEIASITYTGTYNDSITFNWNFGSGQIVNGTGAGPYQVSYPNIGQEIISCTISNGIFTETHIDTIIIKPIPTTQFTTSNILCTGEHLFVTYTGNASQNATYNWNFNGATIISGTGQGQYEITWFTPGTYNVSLNSVSENGCTSSSPSTNQIIVPASILFNSIITNQTSCFGVCDGSATINCSGGTLPYYYSWTPSNSDGQVSNNITNLCSGNYIITVYDSNNCASVDSFTVIQPNEITYIKDITNVTCNGYSNGAATLLASQGTPPYNYVWSNGTNGNSINNVISGNYLFTITDASGCKTNGTLQITQPTKLVVLGEDVKVCIGQSATVNVTAFGGTYPYNFYWTSSQHVNHTGSSLTFNPTGTTNFDIYATDANNCTSLIKTITVSLYPELSLNMSSSSYNICPKDTITISTNISGGNGGPYSCTLNNELLVVPPFNYIPEGNDTTINLIIEVKDFCNTPSVKDTIEITIKKQPTINFFSDTVAGCEPLFVNFVESSPNEGQTYYWNFYDNLNNGYSTEKNPSHYYERPGFYDVNLTVTGANGCKNSQTYENMISVYNNPIARFEKDPIYVSIIDPQVYFDNLTRNIYSSFWDFGDGNYSDENSPYYRYTKPGFYNVTLIAETEHGCKDTVVQEMIVKDAHTFYAPTAFTPDNDGVNDIFFIVGTGINSESYKLYIYDRWGGLIYYKSGYNPENPAESGWDGSVNGGSIGINGVYQWMIIYKNNHGTEFTETGHVSLIR